MSAEDTGKKLAGKPFQSGAAWTGNAHGRPKGSRNKLGEDFIAAMCSDFEQHGTKVIEKVREEKPDQYLKVIASILPKEFHVKSQSLSELSDEEVSDLLDAVRSIIASGATGEAGKRSRGKVAKEDTGGSRRPH